MPERINSALRFRSPSKGKIAAMLVPLADQGFGVRVVVPEEGGDGLGWRVLIDAPGGHASFRIPTDANAAAWLDAVTRAFAEQR